jgi:putative transposase
MFKHKNIRLLRADYLGPRSYFVTICCFKRYKLFANQQLCSWLVDVFRSESAARCFAIHAFCVMPDHFHFLAEGLMPSSDLLNLILSFKMKTTRLYRQKSAQPLWQKKFFDHILRSSDSHESVAWYIWQNSVRQGLCAKPSEHPFSGSFTPLILRLCEVPSNWLPPWKQTM